MNQEVLDRPTVLAAAAADSDTAGRLGLYLPAIFALAGPFVLVAARITVGGERFI